MKQDIIQGQDDCIKPLTYAAIEEEELRVWMPEDDDDVIIQSFDDYYDNIGSNDVTFSEDDLHTSPKSMDLTKEEVEEHGDLMDSILQDYVHTLENMFSERLEDIEAILSDMLMDDNEAEDPEDILSKTLMENMEAEDLEDIFTDTVVKNIEAVEEQVPEA